jgi:hypothetical protein
MFRNSESVMPKLLTLSAVIAGMVVCAMGQSSQESSQGAVPAMQGPGLSGHSNGASATDSLLPNDAGGPMVAPEPVSIDGYSIEFTSEGERSNYLRGGLTFGSSYSNSVAPSGGQPTNGFSYSVGPFITLDQVRSRLSWDLSYTPGFTFYQKTSANNESDHNLALAVKYRLSPHVTFEVENHFSKTSNFLNQNQNVAGEPSIGVPRGSAVIAPIADQWRDISSAQLSYQFSPNGLIGATGSFSDLNYPNRSQVPGILDSTSSTGELFYTHRLSGKHYIGATYDYANLLSHPNGVRTEIHSVLAFYTLYLNSTTSFSVFAGPEHSDSRGNGQAPVRQWSPVVGGSFGWRRQHTSLAMSASRRVSGGEGLTSAVHSVSGNVVVRQQLSQSTTVGVSANYSLNKAFGLLPSTSNGNLISATISFERRLGAHFGFDAAYTRLHQTYNNIAAISHSPDVDHALVSISYRFERPLGR